MDFPRIVRLAQINARRSANPSAELAAARALASLARSVGIFHADYHLAARG